MAAYTVYYTQEKHRLVYYSTKHYYFVNHTIQYGIVSLQYPNHRFYNRIMWKLSIRIPKFPTVALQMT